VVMHADEYQTHFDEPSLQDLLCDVRQCKEIQRNHLTLFIYGQGIRVVHYFATRAFL